MPSRAYSDLDVMNLALVEHLGEPPIALGDTNKRARVLNAIYGSVRDRVLVEHDWDFAMAWCNPPLDTRLSLNPLRPNRFVLPDDCLKVRYLEGLNMDDWEMESATINPNEAPPAEAKILVSSALPPIFVCHTRRIVNPRLWNNDFVEAFAKMLAAAAAPSLAKNLGAGESLRAAAKEDIDEAARIDAREMSGRQVSRDTSWTNARIVGVARSRALGIDRP